MFELPATALDDAGARSATIVFETASDTRLDSVPAVVVVDLTTLEVLRSIDIGEPFVPSSSAGDPQTTMARLRV